VDLAFKKIELIEWLAKVHDKAVIMQIETLKNRSIKESYEAKLKPMSSKTYKAILDKSEAEYKLGLVTDQETFINESSEW